MGGLRIVVFVNLTPTPVSLGVVRRRVVRLITEGVRCRTYYDSFCYEDSVLRSFSIRR